MKTIRLTLPLLFLVFAVSTARAEHHETKGTIIDVAKDAGSFETLLTALDAAGLTGTLEGDGPFTVFAPTDEAFAALPEGTLDALLSDKQALTDVLTYHVVSGKDMSGDIAGMDSVATLQGGELAISTEDGVQVGDATVVSADVEAGNGVIHVIDTVLIP